MKPNDIDITKLPADIRKTFKQLQVLHAEKKIRNKAKDDFLSFVKCVWPDFVEGSHHRHISKKFNEPKDLFTGGLIGNHYTDKGYNVVAEQTIKLINNSKKN